MWLYNDFGICNLWHDEWCAKIGKQMTDQPKKRVSYVQGAIQEAIQALRDLDYDEVLKILEALDKRIDNTINFIPIEPKTIDMEYDCFYKQKEREE